MTVKPLVIHFLDSSGFGGTEQVVLNMLRGSDRSRWDLILAHHPQPDLSPLVSGADSLNVRRLVVPEMRPGWSGARRLPSFRRTLRELEPAVIHFHLTWPLGCQYPIVAAKLAGVHVVVTTVHLYVDLKLSARVMAQQRIVSTWADQHMAVSRHVRDSLVTELRWPGDRVTVVHNGVSVPSVAPTAAPPGHTVLVPARFTAQKGHRTLLEAAVRVPGARFMLAGDGPELPGLVGEARRLGIEDRVLFLGHRDDIAELLLETDVVVLPSLYEGFPLTILEAMAAGKPVVATQIGGIDEMVQSGVNGILVRPADPEALAAGIRRVLDDPAGAGRLGAAARTTVLEQFTLEKMCKRVEEVYDSLLARTTAR